MFWIRDDATEIVERIGLRSVRDAWREGLSVDIVNDRGDRQVVRIDLGTQGICYLKRWRFPPGSKYLLFPGGGDLRKRARSELQNLQLLLNLGITVPRPLAFGEEKGLWGPVASFLLLEELSGYTCCYDRMLEHPDKPEEVVGGIATLLATLHDRRIYYRSPGLKHFYLKPGSGEFAMLDVARLDRGKPGLVSRLSGITGREMPCAERDLSKVLLPLRAGFSSPRQVDSLFWEAYFTKRKEVGDKGDLLRRVEEQLVLREKARERRRNRKKNSSL